MGHRHSEQLVESSFSTDADGNPTGGSTVLRTESMPPGTDYPMVVMWQDGIVGDDGQNGAFVEDVIEASVQRLRFFQASKFRCRENAIALTHLETALAWLDRRTRARDLEGVENSYEQHTEG